MNRKLLRKRVLSRRNWKVDTDTEALAEVNDAINDAMHHLVRDCPAAIMPDTEHVTLLPDRTNLTMGRTLETTTDAWVLSLGGTGLPDAESPVIDGTWDGMYHLEITDEDGVKHRRVARTFFSAVYGVNTYLVTLDRPWTASAQVGMAFRMYAPYFYVKDDVVDLGVGDIWDETGAMLEIIPEFVVHANGDRNKMGRSVGRPETICRGPHKQIQGPLTAPVLSSVATAWAGREPQGRFRACFTFCVGKKPDTWESERGELDPRWESSPSPLSEAFSLSGGTTSLVIGGMPNVDYMLGFDPDPTTILRSQQSGIRKRIYLVRETIAANATDVEAVEAWGVPMFLAEISGKLDSLTWTGTTIPDLERRAPDSSGYFGYEMVPHQDQAYEVDFNVRRNPTALAHDGDTPRLHPVAMEALLLLAEHYVAKLDNAKEAAKDALDLYYRPGGALDSLHKNFANVSQIIPGATWAGTPSPSVARRNLRRGTFTA